jgi:hypothetical protein
MSSTERRRALYLVAVILAITVMFLGASGAYKKGSVKAQSYALLNESSQILKALKSYKEKEGSLPPQLNALVSDGFLMEMPNSQYITAEPYDLLGTEGEISLVGISKDVCLRTQKLTQEKDRWLSVQAKCIETPTTEYKGMMLVFDAL